MPNDDNHQHHDAFSRSASSDVFGKLDTCIPELRIDGDTLAKLQVAANDAGMNLTEFCRTVLRGRVWGVEHVQTISVDRIRRAIGNVGQMPGNTSGVTQ